MDDKIITVIFFALNLLMWGFAIRFMAETKQHDMDLLKKIMESAQKQDDYMHTAHENVRSMTQMNITAMNEFIGQISGKISSKGSVGNEAEDRK